MFELQQHTADIRLLVRAATPEELFSDALRGMFAIMRGKFGTAQIVRRRFVVDSADRTSLLVDFLSEVLSSAHIGRELFDDVVFVKLTGTELIADVVGYSPVDFEQDVKAVTYHEADVRCENGMWTTTLVFDI
ncbi:MAG TPA: archease [Thermoanaerobaculia bacterium]|nr:archease [Thermoanaerobaculia bacterium]